MTLQDDALDQASTSHSPGQVAYQSTGDGPREPPNTDLDDLGPIRHDGALGVLRRGLAVTPELRVGLVVTVVMAVATALGRIIVPIAIQQILDKGVLGETGFQGDFVARAAALTAVAVLVVAVLHRATFLRLIRAAEDSLFGLRTRTFDHIHRLAIADHTETRRGLLVARVTSDVETLAQFTQWGAVSWIVNGSILVGTFVTMTVYSWRLTIVALIAFAPIVPLLKALQTRQLRAYDRVRDTVGSTLSEVSEAVTGAAVVRGYGLEPRSRRRLRDAMTQQYRAHLTAALFFALLFPLADVFGSAALAAVIGVGAIHGPGWGLSAGEIVAFAFLVNLALQPISELSEVLDQTQTAIAGWRKILGVLDIPADVVEPSTGRSLPDGPLGIDVDGISFAYRGGADVLHGVTVSVPAGTTVAVVGETGSGKTTFAKLLCRLADPTAGVIRIGGVDLRHIGNDARSHAIRMVPQDGFLFDTDIAANVKLGRHGCTDDEVREAFDTLGLGWWLDRLPDGLATEVGERGGNLSVGERQLVALARAQVASPGLLILDEATSSVDAETEQALTSALDRLSAGRTVVSVAHRLSTAEAADLVLVFDAGALVEVGTHDHLVAAGGIYRHLYDSWIGATSS